MDFPIEDMPIVYDFKTSRLLISRIDESYLVWFQSSHQFFLLHEPACFVLLSVIQFKSSEEIVDSCIDRYSLSREECFSFVHAIIEVLESHETQSLVKSSHRNETYFPYVGDFPYVGSYQFGQKTMTLKCNDFAIQHHFQPLLSYAQVDVPLFLNLNLELFRNAESLCIESDNGFRECWPVTDIPHFKGAVMGQMLNSIYEKQDADWLMTMHASGVTDGECSVLFSAAAGSGKSTFAALLQARGFELLSDDFIAVDLHSRAYRFPLALSVKDGSYAALLADYPELESISPCIAGNGKSVRFLPPRPPKSNANSFPVKAIVFVNYVAHSEFIFQEISRIAAVQLLLSEIFINPEVSTVSQFMRWIHGIDFYSLTYFDAQPAIQAIQKLFEDE